MGRLDFNTSTVEANVAGLPKMGGATALNRDKGQEHGSDEKIQGGSKGKRREFGENRIRSEMGKIGFFGLSRRRNNG